MKQILIGLLMLLIPLLAACQPETPPPPPSPAEVDKEFSLFPDQSIEIKGTGLTLTLVGVPGDERCPREIECAMSGPVTIDIVLQKDSLEPTEFMLRTFTSNDGRAPDGTFEGIQNSVEYEGYIIRVTGVLPYPINRMDNIEPEEYQVSFVVTSGPAE